MRDVPRPAGDGCIRRRFNIGGLPVVRILFTNDHDRQISKLENYSGPDRLPLGNIPTQQLELKLLFSENITLARRKVIFGFTE